MVHPSGANGLRAVGLGKRVSGNVGPFLPLGPAQKRRGCQRLYGSVLSSVRHGVWKVRWDDGKEMDVNARVLRGEDAVLLRGEDELSFFTTFTAPTAAAPPTAAAVVPAPQEDAHIMTATTALASLIGGSSSSSGSSAAPPEAPDEEADMRRTLRPSWLHLVSLPILAPLLLLNLMMLMVELSSWKKMIESSMM
jgi:hypothetical protein